MDGLTYHPSRLEQKERTMGQERTMQEQTMSQERTVPSAYKRQRACNAKRVHCWLQAANEDLPACTSKALDDYVSSRGPWSSEQFGLVNGQVLMNPGLGCIVGQLAATCCAKQAGTLRVVPYPLKLLIMGPPLSGKSSLAQYLGSAFSLQVRQSTTQLVKLDV